MEPNTTSRENSKTSAKNLFINLGAIIALGMVVWNLLSLLFTVIDKAYPVITPYYYYSSSSISWPVSALIIFFPIYILLMWLLERDYRTEPQQRQSGVRKWLTYITLFFAGLSIAGDLVTVIYYFIDGQDVTTGFILKALSVLVVALGVFFYYISDVMGKIHSMSRKVWTIVSFVIILGAIIWGFSVIGSPRSQQLIKYDEQKVSDLQAIDNDIHDYYRTYGTFPETLTKYSPLPVDPQTSNAYEYKKTGNGSYQLCADFNRESNQTASESHPYVGGYSWTHPAGRYCFARSEVVPL